MRFHRVTAAGLVLGGLAASLAVSACSSTSTAAWCGPLITQLHSKPATNAQYLKGLAAVQRQGAPVKQLIADETASLANQVKADGTGSQPGDVGAIQAAPILDARVTADLKKLNALCGQPADAWKDDDA